MTHEITENQGLVKETLPDYFAGTNGKYYRRIKKLPAKFFEYESEIDANIPLAESILEFPKDKVRRVAKAEEIQEYYPLPDEVSDSAQPDELEQNRVEIPPDTDLNDEENQSDESTPHSENENDSSQQWDTGQMGQEDDMPLTGFPEDVLNNLPPSLHRACFKLLTPDEQATYLVSSLGIISSLLPNVQGVYDGRPVGPNLFVYVEAPFGTGKGVLEYARQLALPTHQHKRGQHEQEKADFYMEQLNFESELQSYKKNKVGEPPVPPKRPPNRMLIIPANSSKTAIIQTIAENENRGLMFETEGDTLADAVKQDYGNFSDVLRKSYHHEPINFLRRGNDGEFVEVVRPHLSLVVSSTFSQLINLIPNAENGLFSRFIFYRLKASPTFNNVFDSRKQDYSAFFSELGEYYKKLYDLLTSRSVDDPVRFALTSDQQARFIPFFQNLKDETRENVGNDLAGSVNRLGLICYRVCMILSLIRVYDETRQVPRLLSCQDLDFDNVLSIIVVLKIHALSIYWQLPKSKLKSSEEEQDEAKLKQRSLCRQLRKQGLSYRDIAKQVLG